MLPPWSNFLLAIIWWVRTVSHWQVQMTLGLGRIWLLNVALASHQAPVCLFLTAPKGLATGGGLLGQLATEGCNHSLWHIWHRLSVCSTIARACVHGLLYPVKPEDGSIEVERVAMKHFPTLQLFICCNRLKEISKGLATMTFFLLKKNKNVWNNPLLANTIVEYFNSMVPCCLVLHVELFTRRTRGGKARNLIQYYKH